jgi:DNA-directed RNA polymerase specialized sigma24 family protein
MHVMAIDAAGPHANVDLARLVPAAQRGDQLAMAELMDVLAPFVGRLCGPIALEHGADATQEALIAIFRGLRGLREPAALFGWARAVAVQEAVRVARRERRRSGEHLLELPARGDPLLSVEIRDTLARLSPEHRAVLVLRDLEGLDEHTASRVLAIAPGTVKSRLARAREGFRRAWER